MAAPLGLPFSEACEQNKEPILGVLLEVFTTPGTVLEIGSGTGQHAVHFARHLPHVTWLPTDMAQHLAGIAAWAAQARLPNLLAPRVLDVTRSPWPVSGVDQVFSANTAHILSWSQVQSLFRGVGEVLRSGGHFALYGPFCYAGRHTAQSNARFDEWLKARDPLSGVRDFHDLNHLAEGAGLVLVRDYAMPVNNRTLVWRRS